jgi:hypothetical protein
VKPEGTLKLGVDLVISARNQEVSEEVLTTFSLVLSGTNINVDGVTGDNAEPSSSAGLSQFQAVGLDVEVLEVFHELNILQNPPLGKSGKPSGREAVGVNGYKLRDHQGRSVLHPVSGVISVQTLDLADTQSHSRSRAVRVDTLEVVYDAVSVFDPVCTVHILKVQANQQVKLLTAPAGLGCSTTSTLYLCLRGCEASIGLDGKDLTLSVSVTTA